MKWTMTLQKPGRADVVQRMEHIAPTLLLATVRASGWANFADWAPFGYRPSLFTEEYALVEVDPSQKTGRAIFTKLRRVPELARNFDPQRLPA